MAKIYFGPKIQEKAVVLFGVEQFQDLKSVTFSVSLHKKGNFLEFRFSKFQRNEGGNKYYDKKKPQDKTMNVKIQHNGAIPYADLNLEQINEFYGLDLVAGEYQMVVIGNVRFRLEPKDNKEHAIPVKIR